MNSPHNYFSNAAQTAATAFWSSLLITAGCSMGICLTLLGCSTPTALSNLPKGYMGKPFHDSVYRGGPQKIPGMVYCAYYDLGGEGVAYHDNTATNLGSGALNPANGTYHLEDRVLVHGNKTVVFR
jgi:hypothetical protein